jgi:hypothetical protein
MGLAVPRKNAGPSLVRVPNMNPLRMQQRPKAVCVAEHSRSDSLVNLKFSCWGYSCSCASLPPTDEGCVVAQNDARRKSGCTGVEHRPLTIRGIEESNTSMTRRRKKKTHDERKNARFRAQQRGSNGRKWFSFRAYRACGSRMVDLGRDPAGSGGKT